jgi:hypothetical protein
MHSLTNPIDHYVVGLPVDANGALCTENADPAIFSQSVGITAGGRVAITEIGFDQEFIDLGAGIVDIALGAGASGGTFVRATTATTVLPNGLIGTVAANQPRSYYDPSTFRTNLILRSQELDNVVWVGAGVTPNTHIAPDGTLTADTLTDNSAVAYINIGQTFAIPNDSANYIISGYIRKTIGVANTVAINVGVSGGVSVAINVRINTNSGVTTGSGGPVIESVGDYWRFNAFVPNNSSGNILLDVAIYPASGTNVGDQPGVDDVSGVGSAVVWGIQIERSAAVTGYIATGATPASAGGTYLGYLSETAGTNGILRSEEFDNAIWTKSFVTISANPVISPDGFFTADKIQETADNNNHIVAQSLAKAAVAIAYTYSCFLKAGERSWAVLQVDDNVNGNALFFDLITGVTGSNFVVGAGFTGVTSSIKKYPNGWYRCAVTFTSSAAATIRLLITPATGDLAYSYLGVVGSGIYSWGVQLESGSLVRSYIQTVAASGARNGDELSYITPLPQTEMTLFAEFSDVHDVILAFSDGTVAERLGLYKVNDARFFVVDGGAVQADVGVGAGVVGTNKMAVAFKLNDFAGSLNGAAVVTDIVGTIPTTDRITVGFQYNGPPTNQPNGTIRRVKYYSSRLSNAMLQSLTA